MNPAEKLGRFGTNGELARKFDITREAVRQWKKKGIPTDRALEIHKLTSGEISVDEILKFAAQAKRIRATA